MHVRPILKWAENFSGGCNGNSNLLQANLKCNYTRTASVFDFTVLKINAKLELILAHCGFCRQENKVNHRTAPLWACLI